MQESGTTLKVHVQPRASRDEIVGLLGGALKVRVTSPPVEGRANIALKRFIARQLGIPCSRIEIIAGQNSREKLLRISNMSRPQVERVLGITLPSV